MSDHSKVQILRVQNYNFLDKSVFLDKWFTTIKEDVSTVVLKPNLVKESHIYKPDEWEYIITHPAVITATLDALLKVLKSSSKIIIADGPQTDSSFKKIISRYPVDQWAKMCKKNGVELEIIDLREDEWVNEGDVTVKRIKLLGDPRGSTEVNLKGELSEFWGHKKSKRGYYGADYDIEETNKAHDGFNNLYRISRTVIEADVFINLPKLKTHKKAGITCCLKNLVGINTYKNYLPHHNEGGPSEGGDQFPKDNFNAIIEGPIMAFLKQNVLRNTRCAKFLKPVKKIGSKLFGSTEQVIRSGNWYGNDTVWRMILDLNKILFYANPDGSMREDKWINAKKYIGIVDAILAGEGNGPLAPDPVEMGYIIMGTNPVAIDAVCARLMGFNPMKIPSIKNAFQIKHYKLVDFTYENIRILIDNNEYTIFNLPEKYIKRFKPHFGWVGHIELDT